MGRQPFAPQRNERLEGFNREWNLADETTAAKELLKCAYSFQYFVETFCYIRDKKAKRWVRFTLWEEQRRAAQTFEEEFKIVCLKARQLGLSWLAAAYAVWHSIFDPIAEILIFSKTEREAKDLLTRIKGIYDRLPEWMKCESVVINQKTEWQLSNGSRIQVLPTTAGDSYAATLIIFDEADHTKDFAAMYNRAEPAVDGGGKIFVISTANKDKPDSLFKTMFQTAMTGLTEFFALFIAWDAHPDRDLDWYEKTRSRYRRLNGSDDEFLGHYPKHAKDALKARTLNKFFPPDWVDRVHDPITPLYWIGRDGFRDAPPVLPNFSGLIIYEMPKPDRRYVIGVDTAEGGEDSNDSAIHVLESGSLIEVAHFSAQLDPTRLGQLANGLAVLYNNASIMVERNNHGHTTIAEISRIGQSSLALGLDGKVGWLTNIVGKPRMYDWAFDVFRDLACVLRTEKTVIQLQSIERSTLKAPEGLSDDCSVSFVLAVACFAFESYHVGWAGVLGNKY